MSRRRRALRAWSALFVVALVAVAAVALAVTGEAETRPAKLRAEGAVAITDSRGGGAIFTAPALGPGGSTRGRVSIRNTGSLPAGIALSQTGLEDVPGPSGGRLSDGLRLTVRDLSAGQTVYSGPLSTMPSRDAGFLLPGWSRVYELTASLPRSAGNAFQGATARVRYRWTATELPLPAAPRPAAPAPRCFPGLRVPSGQRLVGRRWMVARVRVSRTCRVTVRGFVRDRSGRRRFLYGVRDRLLTPGRGHSVRLRLARAPRRVLRRSPRRAVEVHVTTGDASAAARVRVR